MNAKIILHILGKQVDVTSEAPQLWEIVENIINDRGLRNNSRLLSETEGDVKRISEFRTRSTHHVKLASPVITKIDIHTEYMEYNSKNFHAGKLDRSLK